jgi:PHD/YefM family antitoxin component YafN of YafNO toxin-antitoxin module
MVDSFWAKIPNVESLTTPYAILIEQGEHLAKATDGVLRGIVRRGNHASKIMHDFYIEVKPLNNYKYHLLKVLHDVVLYPLTITQNGASIAECLNENEYRDALKAILSSEETSKIVQALLAQANDEDDDIPF